MNTGAASGVVAIAKDAGVPLVSEQKNLTPFQRTVLVKELERQHEELEEKRNSQSGAGHGQMKNSHPAAGQGMGGGQKIQGETVEYVNEGVKEDG